MSQNHGSASIWRHASYKFFDYIGGHNQYGCRGFMLGLNRPYVWCQAANNIPLESGHLYALADGTRIDNCEFGAAWRPDVIKGMSVAFGSGRSGKGAGIIIPALIGGYGGSCVVNDPKGECAWISAQRRRAMGHKVAICDPFNEVNRAYGAKAGTKEIVMRYNPLAALDPNSDTFSEDVSGIAEALVKPGGGNKDDPFFSESGRDLIAGLIAGVVLQSGQNKATFREVREWLTMDDESFAAAVGMLCDAFPRTLAARKLSQYRSINRTNTGIRVTAKQETNFLDSEQLLRYMEPALGEATFSFRELAISRLSVFLVLPATHLVTHSRWLRLMINQALRAVLHERAKQDVSVLFLLDEAGTSLGHLNEIENAYGLTAGMGVVCWSFYQDITQIQRDYPASWQTFIGNSACIQLLSAKDQATCEYFSKYLGTKTVTTTTQSWSKSDSSGTGNSSGSTSVGESTSRGEMGRALMLPEEIRTMPDEEMVVIYPKQFNVKQFKIQYFKDARFNKLYRPDPHVQTQFPAPLQIMRGPNFNQAENSFNVVGVVILLAGLSLLAASLTPGMPNIPLFSQISLFWKLIIGAFLIGIFRKSLGQRSARWYIDAQGILRYS